jgi:hypothetical protein
LTASLEPKAKVMNAVQAEECRRDWQQVLRRVKELHYNRKIGMFESAQADFRKIVSVHGSPSTWQPLDMNVLTVVPQWLCGTFAFHGMLGFRYYKQAANIAHGCAMTFATLQMLQKEPYAETYGLDFENWKRDAFVDGQVNPEFLKKLNRDGAKGKPGDCWFRSGSRCPFSTEAIAAANRGISNPEKRPFLAETARVLPMIHDYCRRRETHERLD